MKLIKLKQDHFILVDEEGKQIGWKLNTQYIKELIGEMDMDKKFQDIINSETPQSRDEMLLEATKHGFKYGYNQCLEEHTKVIHEILDHLCGKMELITQEMIDKGDFQLARYRTAKHC